MKKKSLLVSVVLLVVLLGTIVFATEANPDEGIMPINAELEPTIDADSLTNTPLVGENGVVDENNYDYDYTIPAEWARGTENSARKESIAQDVFVSEDKVNASNLEIDGNVFYSGKEVLVNNLDVYGDLFIAGDYIDVQNIYVSGNIYIAARDIAISAANIVGNMFVAGETISIKSVTAQDIFGGASNFVIDEGTNVSRNVNIAAGTISMDNTAIGRNANIGCDKLNIGSATMILKALNYSSENDAVIKEGASIIEVNKNKISPVKATTKTQSIAYNIVAATLKAVFVCGFILLFAKGFIEKQKTENVFKHIAINTAKGLLWAIVIPVVVILLFCTGIAIGLGFAILAIYFVIFAISLPVVSVSIATALTKNKDLNVWKYYGFTILTAFAIAVLRQIPYIGAFVTIIVGLAGMGLIVSSLKNKKETIKEA